LNDAVAEVIEQVIADVGDVFFYDPGVLDLRQRIAAVLPLLSRPRSRGSGEGYFTEKSESLFGNRALITVVGHRHLRDRRLIEITSVPSWGVVA
jgi:hypothetical protein